MNANPHSGPRVRRVAAVIALGVLMTACMADDQQSQARQELAETAMIQPRNATYDCGEDGSITVENGRTAVRLVEAQGDSYDLPASPPTQTSRYGEGGYALVLEGREALWMKARHEPMTCRR